MALLQPYESLISDINGVDSLVDILPEQTSPWTGYPLSVEPTSFRPNLLMRCRATLTRLSIDILHLLFSNDTPTDLREFGIAVRTLENRLSGFYRGLPNDLLYQKRMPIFQYDFQ